jgi:hypothetical protein
MVLYYFLTRRSLVIADPGPQQGFLIFRSFLLARFRSQVKSPIAAFAAMTSPLDLSKSAEFYNK